MLARSINWLRFNLSMKTPAFHKPLMYIFIKMTCKKAIMMMLMMDFYSYEWLCFIISNDDFYDGFLWWNLSETHFWFSSLAMRFFMMKIDFMMKNGCYELIRILVKHSPGFNSRLGRPKSQKMFHPSFHFFQVLLVSFNLHKVHKAFHFILQNRVVFSRSEAPLAERSPPTPQRFRWWRA